MINSICLTVRMDIEILKKWRKYREAKRVKHAPELEKAILEYMERHPIK